MKNEIKKKMICDSNNEIAYRSGRCLNNRVLFNRLRKKYAKALEENPYVGFFKMREDEDFSFDHKVEMSYEDLLDCDYCAFSRHLHEINSNDTNKLFVYCGDYAFVKNDMGEFRQIRVPYGDPRSEFRKYHDLEQSRPICMSIDRCSSFESNEKNSILFTELDFYYLQRRFATALIMYTQDTAKARILKLIAEEKKD